MAKLKIYGMEFEGQTEIETIKKAYDGCEKLAEAMNGYLAEHDVFDKDGECVTSPWTDEQIQEAFDSATGNNPDVFRMSWVEESVFKAAREKAGLSQAQAAKLTGVPVKTIQRWDQGVATPPKYVQDAYLSKLQAKCLRVQKLYNYRGNNVVYTQNFIKDEVCDYITVVLPPGMETFVDVLGFTNIQDSEGHIGRLVTSAYGPALVFEDAEFNQREFINLKVLPEPEM